MEITDSQIAALRKAAVSLEETMNRLKNADRTKPDDVVLELTRAQPHLRQVQRISSTVIPHPFFGTQIRQTIEAFRGD